MNGRRQRIAREAARILLAGSETDMQRAREKAVLALARGAERTGRSRRGWPTPAEIQWEIEQMVSRGGGRGGDGLLHDARLEALRLMRALRQFRPRLSGGALHGEVAPGCVSFVELHVDHQSLDSIAAASARLTAGGFTHRVGAGGSIEVEGEPQSFRLRFRPSPPAGAGAPGSMGLPELERFLAGEYPWHRFHGPEPVGDAGASTSSNFDAWRMLLEPLADVKQDSRRHPEGDALYHALQVFQLISQELPYDVDLCAAALLHNVGRAIDPRSWREATSAALEDCVSERTLCLVANLPDACAAVSGTIGGRARQRLRQLEDHEELLLLARCDVRGRRPGVSVPELDEVLEFLRELTSYEEPLS